MASCAPYHSRRSESLLPFPKSNTSPKPDNHKGHEEKQHPATTEGTA